METITRHPNTTHLPGHLRMSLWVASNLKVQVRSHQSRWFVVGVTNGTEWVPVASGSKLAELQQKARRVHALLLVALGRPEDS